MMVIARTLIYEYDAPVVERTSVEMEGLPGILDYRTQTPKDFRGRWDFQRNIAGDDSGCFGVVTVKRESSSKIE